MVNTERIYLIRHGRTQWNQEEIYRGQADVPLDTFGRQQARALGDVLRLRGLVNPILLASPLARATETARIVAGVVGETNNARVEEDSSFLDISYGDWEGKSRAQVVRQYPELHELWEEQPQRVAFPGGEDLETVANRAEAGLRRAAGEHPGRELVIVAHRAVNKALLCRLLGMGMEGFWRIRQDTACINELSHNNGSFSVVTVNDTCHLQELGRDAADF